MPCSRILLDGHLQLKWNYNPMMKMGLGLFNRPPRCKPISCKWMFKRKALPDGNTRYKARLVIRGFLQRHGVDLWRPMPRRRPLLPSGCSWPYQSLTAGNYAIWTSSLHFFMGVPEGMDLDPRRYVLKLRRSLYSGKDVQLLAFKMRISLLRGLSDPVKIASSFFSFSWMIYY
jgi:hypothetical protein